MTHYFNSQYGGQTPEIFKLNLLKYLLVNNIVSNMEEFLPVIASAELGGDEFTLYINGVEHIFIWMQGGICYSKYDYNTYIMTEDEYLNQFI